MDILEIIKKYQLMIRPAIFSDGWIAGEFLGVTGDDKAYVIPETKSQATTLQEAITGAVLKIESYHEGEEPLDAETLALTPKIDLADPQTFIEFDVWKKLDGSLDGLKKLKQRTSNNGVNADAQGAAQF